MYINVKNSTKKSSLTGYSGSTAAAIREELITHEQVKGSWHSQKGGDTIRELEKWKRNHPNASMSDRAAAENVIADLKDALGIEL